MDKKIIFAGLTSLVLTLTSCNSTTKQVTLTFKDGDRVIGSLVGPQLGKIKGNSEFEKQISSFELKENTTFKGWYTSLDLSKKVSINNFPSKDMEVYGFFANHVTINLEKSDNEATYPEGETDLYSYSGVQGEEIGYKFPQPSKKESFFSGWYIKDTDTVFDSRFYPASSLTLIPKFTSYPTISFVTNVDNYKIPDVKYNPNEPFKSEDYIDASKLNKGENYKFDAWYYDDQFINRVDFNNLSKTSCTIYAHFYVKRTISYVTGLENVNIPSQSLFPEEQISIPSPKDLIQETKYFDSWYLKDENGQYLTEPFFKNNKVMLDKDITLYAKWLDKPTIEIYTSEQASTPIATFNTFIPGSILNLKNYAKDDITNHLHFSSFYTLNNGQKEYLLDNNYNFIVPSTSTKIYIEYLEMKQLSFNFLDAYKQPLDLSITVDNLYGTKFTKEDISNYLKPYLSKSAYLNENNDYIIYNYYQKENDSYFPFDFPLTISEDTNIYLGFAFKVNLNLNIYLDNNLITTIDLNGYQNQDITENNPISITKNNKYSIYNQEVEIPSNSAEFSSSSLIDENYPNYSYDLTTKFPDKSLKIRIDFSSLN